MRWGEPEPSFRKQISDVTGVAGAGTYRCTYLPGRVQTCYPGCNEDGATGSVRNHVVNVHGMRHMRRLKMQWLGNLAIDKSNKYKDKSAIWNQKIKDIERARILALQESGIQSIPQKEVSNISAGRDDLPDDAGGVGTDTGPISATANTPGRVDRRPSVV